ncbi:MAG: GNAT family N-acetyltransferase [Hyphomicrobiaceae bacterium]|nr:GNAT family N-acetyltransferase [Hyphomicrobiaceae bacterium]
MSEITITEVVDGTDLEAVRELCRAFRRGQYERYAHQIAQIEEQYGEAVFEKTLAALTELHGPPHGVILLARMDREPAGCVMLARISDATCEMKRMFVEKSMRHLGIGKTLCGAVIKAAHVRGYARMRLDTGPLQHEALALYHSFGFAPRDPYEEDGPKWPDKVFLALDLKASVKGGA